MYILKQTKFGSHQLGPDTTVGNGLTIEILLTFILVLVILRTAADTHGHVRH
jgi:glycerol uptake facilitator-like aquaporin